MLAEAVPVSVPYNPQHEDPVTDSDDEDAQSITSTEAYSDYEPFQTFKGKVLELCRILWPNHHQESDFLIERLKGGASNRIVSISVHESKTSEPINRSSDPSKVGTEDSDLPSGDYILRIPRWGPQTTSHEMAMLRFLKGRLSLSVPTVVHADLTVGHGNPLGVPYVLQVRIPGQRLDCVWPCLNHTQRLLVTLDLARLHADLARIRNPSCGIPDVERGLAVDGTLNTTKPCLPGDARGSKQLATPQAPADVLCQRLARWHARYKDFGASWSHAAEIVSHMHATNTTFGPGPGGSPYYLQHGDLFPRNIMVHTSGENVAYVTGILDWDDATFAPAVVAFSAPAWLWIPGWWKGYDEDDWLETEDLWRGARREPEDQHCRDIKNLFDMVVGPEYLKHAYAPDAHAARRIWMAAHEDVGNSWTQKQLDELYDTWKKTQDGGS